jgi:hypothetical protein
MSSKRQRRKLKQRRKVELREDATKTVKLKEVGKVTGTGALREATIIESGWGSSGYYSKELLERDGAAAFPAGTHMYLNHSTMTEEYERPERDVRDMVGVLETDPHVVGNELKSRVKIFEHWQPVIDELAPHTGLSIRAGGHITEGEKEGKTGIIVEKIVRDPMNSVDVVTAAGAGGKLGALIESARGHQPEPDPEDPPEEPENTELEESMLSDIWESLANTLGDQSLRESRSSSGGKDGDPGMAEISDKELSELRESVRQTETRVSELEESKKKEEDRADRAEDALLTERGARIVNEFLSADPTEGEDAIPQLPERAVARVREAAQGKGYPLTEDGKDIDKDKLIERVRKAAKEEDEYLKGGVGNGVTSLGESAGTSSNGGGDSKVEESEAKLQESLQRIGLSEDAAKLAAKGR